jgi:hypothetical protein
MLLILFPTVKQTWPCCDDVRSNVFYCSFLNTNNKKKRQLKLWILPMCYSRYKILEHVDLIENLSKININRYLFKWSRWPLKDLCVLQHPYIRDILIWNTRCGISYQFRDIYTICSTTGMLSGQFTMWKFRSCQISFSTDPNYQFKE